MTRRADVHVGRLFPLLLVAGVVAAVAVAALLAACGGSSGGSPEPSATVTAPASASASPSLSPTASTSPTTAPQPVTVYFMRDGALCAAERLADDQSSAATLRALLRGPTAEEAAAGVASDIPRGVRLLEYSEDGDRAIVDLSSAYSRSGDEAQVKDRLAQVVYTVTGMGDGAATRVVLRLNGVPIDGMPSQAGDVEYFPTRAGYRELEPAIFVEHPGLGAVLSSPATLSGTASVSEGAFTARLVDGSGRRIVSVPVQASRGAPGRGRFSRELAFSTSSAAGTLIVYSESMEDGSRQNVVSIPVTFATP